MSDVASAVIAAVFLTAIAALCCVEHPDRVPGSRAPVRRPHGAVWPLVLARSSEAALVEAAANGGRLRPDVHPWIREVLVRDGLVDESGRLTVDGWKVWRACTQLKDLGRRGFRNPHY